MALQGIPERAYTSWGSIVSTKQMGEMVGNAFSTCLLTKLIHCIFQAMGLDQ